MLLKIIKGDNTETKLKVKPEKIEGYIWSHIALILPFLNVKVTVDFREDEEVKQ